MDCGEPATDVRDNLPVCGLCAVAWDAELFAGAWCCGDDEEAQP
jgi:hypothetical protein